MTITPVIVPSRRSREAEAYPMPGASRLSAYRFSPAIRAQLRKLHVLDNWHGPLAWFEDAVWVSIAILAAKWSGSVGYFWPTYLFFTFPILAVRQRAAATLVHESAHGILAKNKKLNRLLGTYLSGYLILQSLSAYFSSHVKDHHGNFGDPTRDPDLRDHIRVGLYEPWTAIQFVCRYLIRPIVASQFPLIRRLLLTRLAYSGTDRRELLKLGLFLSLLTAAASLLFGVVNVALFWYVPLLLGFPVVNWYMELLEHFPYPASAKLDIDATRHRAVGPITRHFFSIHNEGYHLDHHLSPGIPFWNLPQAHKVRLQDPRYAAAIARSYADQNGNIWRQFRAIVWERPARQPDTYELVRINMKAASGQQ
jgi:fatty acid desaturase